MALRASAMSQLAPLLAKLKESGAERVHFAPNELGMMIDGDNRRPLPGGPVRAATILEAISELLSHDDIDGLSSTRPRIVRHEHDGEDFVLEIQRQSNGVALGIRPASKPRVRDSVRREDPPMRSPAPAPAATPAVATPTEKRPSRRPKAPSQRPPVAGADKRTVRAIVDDDGNLVDPGGAVPLELDRGRAPLAASPPPRLDPQIKVAEERIDTKPVKRSEPTNAGGANGANGLDAQAVMKIARDVAQEAAREAAREVARDAAREVAREAAREAARDAAREVAREAAREATHELARDLVRDMSRGSPAAAGVGAPPAAPGKAPARSGPAKIDTMLREMLQRKASDLHLPANAPPVLRVDGEMHFGKQPIGSNDIMEMMREIMTERAAADFASLSDADFAYEIPGLARFRVNVFQDRNGTGAVLRQIPIEILSAEKLGLPKACLDLCWLTKGLVLVTGPTGSGKSTTLAAMIDFINKNRSDHIITIEDPVEFVHQNQRCLVNQREVGQHTKSFKNALRAALREDPDIVLVGEMRDLETISIAIETAETGHLVFGTLHTTTAISTVDRIIDQFPSDRQDQIRVMLSESLKGVIAQILCPKVGGGRVAAHEILLGSHAVAAMIREGKTFQLASVMQTSKNQGMVTMNDSLMSLVQRKLVDPKQAYMKAVDKNGFVGMLKAAGIPPPV